MTAHPTVYRGELFTDEETRLAESVRDIVNPAWDVLELAFAIRLANLTRA